MRLPVLFFRKFIYFSLAVYLGAIAPLSYVPICLAQQDIENPDAFEVWQNTAPLRFLFRLRNNVSQATQFIHLNFNAKSFITHQVVIPEFASPHILFRSVHLAEISVTPFLLGAYIRLREDPLLIQAADLPPLEKPPSV